MRAAFEYQPAFLLRALHAVRAGSVGICLMYLAGSSSFRELRSVMLDEHPTAQSSVLTWMRHYVRCCWQSKYKPCVSAPLISEGHLTHISMKEGSATVQGKNLQSGRQSVWPAVIDPETLHPWPQLELLVESKS